LDFASPCRQTSPSQHPAQLLGPQLAIGAASQPPEAPHTAPAVVQSTHGPPLFPQAASLAPSRHWLFLQQPAQPSQPVGVGGAWQTPVAAWHSWPAVLQLTQAPPPWPQARLLVPPWQRPPWQQPAQLPHPDAGEAAVQPPLSSQLSPAAQTKHAKP